MYYAYVAQSIAQNDKFYKGHTEDLHARLKEHNRGTTKSIKHLIPVRIIYYEGFDSLAKSIETEKYWKTAAGRRYLRSKLSNGPVVQWIE